MKAQAGLEFMVMFAMVLLVFAFSVYVYSLFMDQGVAIKTNLEAHRICNQVASSISSLSMLGGNATYTFALPAQVNYNSYTIYIAANHRYISVDYGTANAGCYFRTTAITNSTNSTFFVLQPNARIVSNRGVMIAYP